MDTNNKPEKLIDCISQHAHNPSFSGAEGESIPYSVSCDLGSRPPFTCTQRRLVFCLVDNTVDSLSGYFALLAANAVPMLLSPTISPEHLHTLVNLYKPGFIWLPMARSNEFIEAECLAAYGGQHLLDLHNTEFEIHESLGLLLSTSGSTGNPKFVRLSHTNIVANAQSISEYLGLTSDERPITTLPPSYSYGLSIIHSHGLAGADIAVTDKTFFDRAFWEFLRQQNATSFGGVPYHYEMLKRLKFIKMQLPSLRTLTQAGGRMPPELTRDFATYCAEHGIRFFSMYGQTEATARMSYLPPEQAIDKAGSIGVAIPGGKFWLQDEVGQLINQADTTGELVYEGPNVCMGYATNYLDLAKGDELNNVLRTGDLAYRASDSNYYITGRLNRFIKLFGKRTNLLDIENFLRNQGHVVVCAGQDDCLEIYLTNPEEGQAASIKKSVVTYLQIAISGVAIYGINELPYSESGKIQFGLLNPQGGSRLA